jgi:chorismate synthase
MFNTLGNILKLTTYGESHGECIGGILDGFPAGVDIDIEYIQSQLNRRKPGQSSITTSRKEADELKILSGLKNGKTTGHSIGFQLMNTNQKSEDYQDLSKVYRPSHADFTYNKKYGVREERGGGRSSARETANWVVAGAFAMHLIPDIRINSYVHSIHNLEIQNENIDFENIEKTIVRCPDLELAKQMISLIEKTKLEGDSLGGVIRCVVQNMPIGLGEPIFHKLEAELARAMLSINACKGFEIGSGFSGTRMKGSEHNDSWLENGKTSTNNSGGIQGGISNGMDLDFKLAFKPTSTILKSQETIDIHNEKIHLEVQGRHDPCVLPRAVPIVDMLTSFVLADMMLMSILRIKN